ILFVLLFAASLLNAQENKQKEPWKYKFLNSFGIWGGFDYSGLSGDSPEDVSYSNGIGYQAGLSLEFNITEDIKILFHPQYNVKSVKLLYDIGEDEPVDSMKMKFDYYRFPVSVKIMAFNGYTYFISGLDPGYLSKATLQDKEEVNPEQDIAEYVNEFDLAANFGFGVNFKIKKHDLFLEIIYSQSILNMSSDKPKFNSDLPQRFRMSGIQFNTGFYFNI
ncbi:MAG: PorT family protein, partial [Ignavibacteria bacterium]|nr:PorT family protein [Ignavibacteria bacterium]